MTFFPKNFLSPKNCGLSLTFGSIVRVPPSHTSTQTLKIKLNILYERPNFNEIINNYNYHIGERKNLCVKICGPNSLHKSLNNIITKLNKKNIKIEHID